LPAAPVTLLVTTVLVKGTSTVSSSAPRSAGPSAISATVIAPAPLPAGLASFKVSGLPSPVTVMK
jgi:hypothetical protein